LVLGDTVVDRYTFYVSDECLIAPNAFFYPDLFELTGGGDNKRRMRLSVFDGRIQFCNGCIYNYNTGAI
jgi:hypothetical protein